MCNSQLLPTVGLGASDKWMMVTITIISTYYKVPPNQRSTRSALSWVTILILGWVRLASAGLCRPPGSDNILAKIRYIHFLVEGGREVLKSFSRKIPLLDIVSEVWSLHYLQALSRLTELILLYCINTQTDQTFSAKGGFWRSQWMWCTYMNLH